MATELEAPGAAEAYPIDETAVLLRWLPALGAEGYEVQGEGSDVLRVLGRDARSAVIRGLRPGRNAVVRVRATHGDEVSDWTSVEARPSAPLVPAPTDGVLIVQVLDADRQSLQMRLPDAEGVTQEVRLTIWWQPSDGGWWGGLEVPVNTPVVRSRSLALNCGVLDDTPGILAGNLVMRATQNDSEEEPGRRSFAERTHELRWEPL